MLNVYLKQRSKYRFVDGVSVLYNHSTSYLDSRSKELVRFRAFSRQAVQSGFFQAARLPGLQRFRAFSRRIQSLTCP
jgi:hypothetical protein